jgi:hypothetical protein
MGRAMGRTTGAIHRSCGASIDNTSSLNVDVDDEEDPDLL